MTIVSSLNLRRPIRGIKNAAHTVGMDGKQSPDRNGSRDQGEQRRLAGATDVYQGTEGTGGQMTEGERKGRPCRALAAYQVNRGRSGHLNFCHPSGRRQR